MECSLRPSRSVSTVTPSPVLAFPQFPHKAPEMDQGDDDDGDGGGDDDVSSD